MPLRDERAQHAYLEETLQDKHNASTATANQGHPENQQIDSGARFARSDSDLQLSLTNDGYSAVSKRVSTPQVLYTLRRFRSREAFPRLRLQTS
jgi:hypothetical protein